MSLLTSDAIALARMVHELALIGNSSSASWAVVLQRDSYEQYTSHEIVVVGSSTSASCLPKRTVHGSWFLLATLMMSCHPSMYIPAHLWYATQSRVLFGCAVVGCLVAIRTDINDLDRVQIQPAASRAE